MSTHWKEEMIYATVIYRMAELGELIPYVTVGTDFEFIDAELHEMSRKGLLKSELIQDEMQWQVTEKGLDLRNRLIQMFDQLINFEIFSNVNLAIDVPDDFFDESGDIRADELDPRFYIPQCHDDADAWQTEDLRLAMVEYMAQGMGKVLSSHRIVFLQMLIDGRLRDQNIWVDLKLSRPFNEIEEIVESAYKWTETADSVSDAADTMKGIYAAGMLEQRKRDAAAENDSQSDEEIVIEETIYDDAFYEGTSPFLDFENYGYVSYGYYDLYDPFYDAVAFGILCTAMF